MLTDNVLTQDRAMAPRSQVPYCTPEYPPPRANHPLGLVPWLTRGWAALRSPVAPAAPELHQSDQSSIALLQTHGSNSPSPSVVILIFPSRSRFTAPMVVATHRSASRALLWLAVLVLRA
ncbi:hypothetical protein MAPG_00055 [Magnaporthiopsis poae ATCC 64411]|uniref:Uncharacterized protein n=1 Tax=Magnaporthiopsis poae (strain ATCC 64411 / 73-15) TaxID=644358 RepID=A0A0C4DJZ5_MAGP6|nr:hypothetical protein MAPG_00055 [Magnaporthiopsis poae ATCC 64411]